MTIGKTDTALLGSRIAGGNTAYSRNKYDAYPTPPDVTKALLDFLRFPKTTRFWECACGDGYMVNAIRDEGYEVIGTDIQTGTDYLSAETPEGVDFIISNPPFSLAREFIVKYITRKIPFAFLVKSQFWHAGKRLALFRSYPPTYVLPLTWRPDFLFKSRGGGSPLMDVMWVVWIPKQHETRYWPLERPKERT